MSKFAWVTLTTNDTYSLGALVLAHSLRRAGTVHQLAVLVTPGVSESMRQKLKEAYNVVQEVNVMDSQDSANLALLARPELGITFTKLHCWRLVQFEKCVFLDSDTLILQNCDELFEREEFSAAPDVSWPDCFNSGVFVYTPSQATFDKIVEFALKNGSFDGGDQGLLNQYFADWATSDNKKRLPFLYNVTAYASYCYLPAFKQFRDKIKILHFAGKMKPWLIHYNSQSKTASVPTDYTHASDLIQLWWNIFFDHVHAQLNTDMLTLIQECEEQDTSVEEENNENNNKKEELTLIQVCEEQDNSVEEENNENNSKQEEKRYSCPSLIPWKCNYDNMRLQQQQEWQQIEYHSDSFQYEDEFHELYANDQIIEFHDPWEDYYRKQEEEAAADIQHHNKEDDHRTVMQDVHVVDYAREQNQVSHNFTREQNTVSQNFTREQEHVEEGDGVVAEEPHVSQNYARDQEHVGDGHHLGHASGKEDHVSQEHVFDQCEGVHVSHNYTPQQEHVEEEPVSHNYTHGQDDTFDHHGDSEQIAQHTQEIELSTNVEAENFSRASSNYDNSATDTYHTGNDIECASNSDYTSARSQQTLTPTDESCDDASTSRSIPVDTSSPVTQSVDKVNDHKSGEEVGLAGALSQLRLGEQRSPEQESYEHLMRRQCWESGQVDYMGRDSFDNIWKKITQTLETKPADDDKTDMLTSADIEDGKVEFNEKTGVKVEYNKIEGGYTVKTTTPQGNGGWKSSTQTFYDPKPVTEEDMKKQMANKKVIKTRMNKEIRIDDRTTMLTRAIEGGYEEVYTTVNEDGTKTMKTKTFFDAVPEGTPFPAGAQQKPAPQQPGSKKTITRKSSVESTDSTDSRKMVQRTNKNSSTVEESRRVTQNYEVTENNRTVRKNSLQTEQTIKSITSNVADGKDTSDKKKKITKKASKIQAPPPPPDFVQNDTTSVSTKRVPGGIEYTYSTQLESGKTITTSKTIYEEEECELTEEEIRAYKKTLKDAEKHKNVTTTKKLKSESGTKKVVPSENPGDVTTVETIKIQGGTEYHYTTVTSEGIVKKACKTVYDPVPCSNPDDTEEEEIIEEYEEEIIEPGEKNIRTIETIKSLPQKFEEEVTFTHEKKEKKTKKTMTMVSN